MLPLTQCMYYGRSTSNGRWHGGLILLNEQDESFKAATLMLEAAITKDLCNWCIIFLGSVQNIPVVPMLGVSIYIRTEYIFSK